MAKNPHFRVLALTATPGSTPEAVQGIVDSLHISHIEIRDENSIDLRGYMHKKHSQQQRASPPRTYQHGKKHLLVDPAYRKASQRRPLGLSLPLQLH